GGIAGHIGLGKDDQRRTGIRCFVDDRLGFRQRLGAIEQHRRRLHHGNLARHAGLLASTIAQSFPVRSMGKVDRREASGQKGQLGKIARAVTRTISCAPTVAASSGSLSLTLASPLTRSRAGLPCIAMKSSPTCGLRTMLPRLLNMPLPS